MTWDTLHFSQTHFFEAESPGKALVSRVRVPCRWWGWWWLKLPLYQVGYLCLGAWGVGEIPLDSHGLLKVVSMAKELLKWKNGSTSDCPTLLEIDVGPAPSLGRMLVLPKIGVSGKTDWQSSHWEIERLSSGFLVNTIRNGWFFHGEMLVH